MNTKTTYILFGILVAILLIVGLTWWFEPVYEETGKYLFPSANGKTTAVKSEDIVKVKVERTRPDAGSMVFERDKDNAKFWNIVEPRPLRADSSKIDSLVSESLRAEINDKADVPADLKAAELDPPAETITLTTKDGKELKVNAGAESPGSGAVVYLDSSEKPSKPIPVSKDSVGSLLHPLTYFREAHLLASASSDFLLVNLTLNKTDKKEEPKGSLVLIKHKDDSIWEYKDPAGYDGAAASGDASAPLDKTKPPSGVDALTRDLSNLVVSSTDSENDWVKDDPKDLDEYGLDPAKSDVLTIKIDRALDPKGEKKVPMTLSIALGKKAGEDKYFAAVHDDQHGTSVAKIATLIPDAIALLFKDPTTLRSRNLVALGALKQPVAVTVKNDAGSFQFLREHPGDPWKLYREGSKEEIAADSAAVDRFVNQLVQEGQVREFLPADSDKEKLGLTKQTSAIAVYIEGVRGEEVKKDEKTEEKKDDKSAAPQEPPKTRLVLDADKVKPAAQLLLAAPPKEGDLAAVQRGANHSDWSESTLVKAPKEIAKMAQDGPLTYYDKRLPQFNPFPDLPDKGVTDLQMVQDGATTYLVHRDDDKPDTPWKFKQPTGWENRKVDGKQVETVLRELDDMPAMSLTAEAAKDEDYGINPTKPILQAVVTKKDDKSSPYTITFGKDAPDGGVYAKQSQRPVVFEVNKTVVEALKQDVRDRTVFALDPAKIKSLKLTQSIKGVAVPVVVEYDKTGDAWTAKPEFKVDSEKVEALATGLARLTAGKIVTKDDAIKKAFDADEEKTALKIEMTVDGEAKPLQLTVVNLTGDKAGVPAEKKGYYASSENSPNLPGEVFQAPLPLFEGPMKGSEYFKKP
jgi:hypothetical protein